MRFVPSAARVSVGPLFGSAALVALLFTGAHGEVRTTSLSGEISTQSGIERNDLTVELVPLEASQSTVIRAPASTLGQFSIAGIRPGEYQVRVADQYGNVLSEQYVRVTEFSEHLKIRLPGSKAERPVTGAISAARLAHKVPKQALKEFRKSQRAAKDGDEESAVAHLRKAIEIDPAYLEAHNNLGAKYMRAGQPAQALEQFEKALPLDPSATAVLANVAAVRLALRQYPQAGEAARRALKFEPRMVRARFLLGVSLAAQGRQDTALENLEAAAEKFPEARLVAAEILMRQGEEGRAAATLREIPGYQGERAPSPGQGQAC